jgi:TorA maturation chaperone TorD
MSEATVALHRRLEPEDRARADFYALLGRLFASPPDAALLALVARAQQLEPANAAADEGARALAAAWDRLRAASAAMAPEAAADEFHQLFIGVGRSEVSPYASHYVRPQSGRPLADIRGELQRLGLSRLPESSEFEDHIAVILETMRMLVSGDAERAPVAIAEQRAFFERFVAPWIFDCCAAIEKTSIANYYRAVAQFTGHFLAIERDSLAMG